MTTPTFASSRRITCVSLPASSSGTFGEERKQKKDSPFFLLRLPTRVLWIVPVLAACASLLVAAEPARAAFDVPAGKAEISLKQLSEQSGVVVLFPTDVVTGVRTNAVKGQLTPREALDAMLSGTGLVAVSGKTTASLTVRKETEAEKNGGSRVVDAAMVEEGTKSATVSPASRGAVQADAHGIVIGSVYNEATGDYLGGAAVSIEGTSLTGITDRTGRFEISRAPAGPQMLKVSYPGLDRVSESIVVAATGVTTVRPIPLTSEVYRLEKFVVTGIREGNSAAIAAQRQAANAKTVVSTDAFGEIASGNLGEFLKRLPGIGGTGIDEVENIRVDGMSANFTNISLDGTRLPSPGGQSTDRSISVDTLPADFIASIEVVRAPTPDMDADGMGGTVNLISKSALDLNRRLVSYRAGMNFQTEFGERGPFGNFQYSDVLGKDRKLGVFVTLNYNRSFRDQDRTQSQYGGSAAGPNPAWRFQLEPDERTRDRMGGGVKLDYKFSDTSSVNFGLMYNTFKDDQLGRLFQVQVREDRANPPVDVRDLSTKEPSTNLRTVMALAQEHIQSNTQINTQRTLSLQAGGKQEWLGSGYRIDYGATYAPAVGHQDRWLFDLKTGRTSTWVIERKNDTDFFPTMTRTGGTTTLAGDWNPIGNKNLYYRFGESQEAVWSGLFNLTKNLDTRIPVTVKTGLRYRGQELQRQFYEDGSGREYQAPDWNLFKTYDLAKGRSYFGRADYTDLAIYPNSRAVYQYTKQNPQYWSQAVSSAEIAGSLRDDGTAREEVEAAYVQAETRLGRFRALGGLRMEDTRVRGTGWVFHQNPAAPPAGASNQQLTDFYTAQWTQNTNKRDYRNWFPGLHLRYEFTSNLLARASYSEAIGRPDFRSIMPSASINDSVTADGDPAQSIRMNNAGLLPETSKNFNVSLEYYFEPVGLFSVSGFQKRVRNFPVDIRTNLTPSLLNEFGLDPKYEGWLLVSEGNGGAGEVRGVEIAFNQHLGGYARWLRGFSINANYTHVSAEGQLTNIIPDTWNFGVAYSRVPWTVRFDLNYNAEHQTQFDPLPMHNEFSDDSLNGEVSLRYSFSPKFSIFANINNVFRKDIPDFVGGAAANGRLLAYQIARIGQRASIGVSGKF